MRSEIYFSSAKQAVNRSAQEKKLLARALPTNALFFLAYATKRSRIRCHPAVL
ncbi:MAG: hypothetical protein V4700_04565 [Pseudomonadota bacterium]